MPRTRKQTIWKQAETQSSVDYRVSDESQTTIEELKVKYGENARIEEAKKNKNREEYLQEVVGVAIVTTILRLALTQYLDSFTPINQLPV